MTIGVRPARILLATFGTLGDIHPFIALAVALRRRGFDPVLMTSAMHRAAIESFGVAFAPMRPDEPDIARALGLDVGGVLRRVRRDPHFILDEIYLRFLAATYADVQAPAKSADLIVTQSLLLGAHLAAETSGKPWFRAALAPIHLQSAADPSLTPPLPYRLAPRSPIARQSNRMLRTILRRVLDARLSAYRRFRRELGLPLDRDAYVSCGRSGQPGPIVGLYSAHFAELVADHPREARLVGFPVLPAAAELPPALAGFLRKGPAPIVFSLGSFAVEGADAFYAASLDAAAVLGRRALILSGTRAAEWLGSRAGAMAHVAAYAPHACVFPHAAAIVHHGGIGTTAEALRSGRPQLVVPHFGDQHDNAARLARLGVADVLAPRRYTAERASDALRRLLDATDFDRMSALARVFAAENGAEAFVDLIEARLAGGQATSSTQDPDLRPDTTLLP